MAARTTTRAILQATPVTVLPAASYAKDRQPSGSRQQNDQRVDDFSRSRTLRFRPIGLRVAARRGLLRPYLRENFSKPASKADHKPAILLYSLPLDKTFACRRRH